MRRFAISDIHGCLKSFQALLEQIKFGKEDELYLLGDYIDRGPDSRGVIDHIWALQSADYKVICLKGNHEQMMLNALDSADSHKHWLQHGGLNTLSSFGTNKITNISSKYITWLRHLPHFHKLKHYILVHAGLNFKKEDPMSDTVSMLWIRQWYDCIDRAWLNGRTIIHGHTPIVRASIENMLSQIDELPVLDIDGGCVFREAHFQQLVAYDLDRKKLFFQDNIE
jgi:serine/threonine protein phosphatase 1